MFDMGFSLKVLLGDGGVAVAQVIPCRVSDDNYLASHHVGFERFAVGAYAGLVLAGSETLRDHTVTADLAGNRYRADRFRKMSHGEDNPGDEKPDESSDKILGVHTVLQIPMVGLEGSLAGADGPRMPGRFPPHCAPATSASVSLRTVMRVAYVSLERAGGTLSASVTHAGVMPSSLRIRSFRYSTVNAAELMPSL